MFPLLLEPEPSAEDLKGNEEEEEEEAEELPDEFTLFLEKEITECFALFDKTQSDTFETKYLEKALKCLGIFLTSVEMTELTQSMDQNGVVTLSTFREYAMERLKEADPFDSLSGAFRTFDPDNEGMVPSDRLKRWLTTLGDPLTEKEAKELVKMGDPGNKGFVLYQDLVGILLN